MPDNDIILQINVRRIAKPPFYDFSIDKNRDSDGEAIALFNFVMFGLKRTIDEVADKYGSVHRHV